MNMDTLSGKIKLLAELKDEKKRMTVLTKENNEQIDACEREIISSMLDMADAAGLSCVDDFHVAVDGRRYGVTTKPFYSIPADQRDTAFKALRALNLKDLIVERVDDRALTKVLQELIEQNDGELPEAYQAIPMRHYEKMTISDRKIG